MTKTKILGIKIFAAARNQYFICIFDNTDDDITHDTVDTEEGRDNSSALFFVITSHQLTHCFGGNSTNNNSNSSDSSREQLLGAEDAPAAGAGEDESETLEEPVPRHTESHPLDDASDSSPHSSCNVGHIWVV